MCLRKLVQSEILAAICQKPCDAGRALENEELVGITLNIIIPTSTVLVLQVTGETAHSSHKAYEGVAKNYAWGSQHYID